MLGCYSNKSPTNALPDSFDSNVSIVKGVEAIFNYCKAKAEAFGYNMFGADNKNCWSGDNAEGTYNTYGVSNLCSINIGQETVSEKTNTETCLSTNWSEVS